METKRNPGGKDGRLGKKRDARRICAEIRCDRGAAWRGPTAWAILRRLAKPAAKVAELVDAPALGAGAERRESSSLSFRTNALSLHSVCTLARQRRNIARNPNVCK